MNDEVNQYVGLFCFVFFMFIVLCKRLEPPFLSLFFASNESDFLVTLLSTWDIFFFKFLVFEHFQRNVLLFVELLYNDQFYIFRHVVTSSKNTFVPIYLTEPLKNLHKIRQLDM